MHSPKNRRSTLENEGQGERLAVSDLEHILELWNLVQCSLVRGQTNRAVGLNRKPRNRALSYVDSYTTEAAFRAVGRGRTNE